MAIYIFSGTMVIYILSVFLTVNKMRLKAVWDKLEKKDPWFARLFFDLK